MAAVKKIGVLTSGGDAPGMNAAIRAVVRMALHLGMECVGIRRGYQGLIAGDAIPLDFASVSDTSRLGGTWLHSARSAEFMTEAGLDKACQSCRALGLDALVAIGGDGTFRGLRALAGRGIRVAGIPATIDNDIACTDYTIGYDTACNTALESIDKLRDTMKSHERCSVVEVMGRYAGHLAMAVGIACGATAVLTPERPLDYERDVIAPILRARQAGRSHFMVIVAEGVKGTVYDVMTAIEQATGLDTRVTVLGHIQRGGAPTARDRMAATYLGHHAVKLLAAGQTCRVVALRGEQVTDFDITEALAMEKGLQEYGLEVLDNLTGRRE